MAEGSTTPTYDNLSEEAYEGVSEEMKTLLLTTAATTDDFKKEIECMQDKETSPGSLKKTFKKRGVEGVAKKIRQAIDKWQEENVDIAVIGRSGVGKSCFINAIRGDMDESLPDYAPVGNNECTSKRQPYPHPANKCLIFWDLPGVGTAKFPRKTYLKNKEIKLKAYDVFILMTCDRFTEDEVWLGKELKKRGKKIIFVRSKVDNQIRSDKELKKKAGKTSNPQAVIDEIRENCEKNLEHLGDGFDDIYLINNIDILQPNLDFGKLIDGLVNRFQGLKAEALLFTFDFLTPTLLDQKLKLLRKRIWGIGILSGLCGAAPVPGTSLVVDAILIEIEMHLYRKQLGLTDTDMSALAACMQMPFSEIVNTYFQQTHSLPQTAPDVFASSRILLASESVKTATLIVPFAGMAVGATSSFATTVALLRSSLAIMEKDAKIAMDQLMQSTNRNVIQFAR